MDSDTAAFFYRVKESISMSGKRYLRKYCTDTDDLHKQRYCLEDPVGRDTCAKTADGVRKDGFSCHLAAAQT